MKNNTISTQKALNLTSTGGTRFGFADQVVFFRSLGGSVQAIFAFIFNGKLHAITISNDGAGNFFQFLPKSVLINTFGYASAYATGFVETADAGLTLAPQNSAYPTGMCVVTNISATDAANAINTITAIEKGSKQYPTTEGYFVSTDGLSLPPTSAMPITTADGTVPNKKTVMQSESNNTPSSNGIAGDTSNWLKKNWGYIVGAVGVVIVLAYLASKRS